MKQVGVNCFGLNALIHQDFEGTAAKLKEIGFTHIEPMVVFPAAQGADPSAMAQRLKMAGQDGVFWVNTIAEERIAYLREMGFTVDGIHLGLVGMVLGGLKTVLPYAAEFAAANELRYVVHSPQKKSLKEMQPDAEAMREGAELLKKSDCELIFHCHYQEFTRDEGDTPFDYLMRLIPDLRVELDVGWVQYAGEDVLAVMDKYQDRIAIVHFKDIVEGAAEKGPKGIFTAIGEGSLPLPEILRKAEGMKLSYGGLVIDQDASLSGDMLRDLEVGFRNLQTM